MSIHRMSNSWGEAGSDASGNEFDGTSAQQFDATWLFNFFDGSAWVQPGGDFAGGSSAATTVSIVGTL